MVMGLNVRHGEINNNWDNNVARSMLWWYDLSERSYTDRRNATYYDVNLKVVFDSNGGS